MLMGVLRKAASAIGADPARTRSASWATWSTGVGGGLKLFMQATPARHLQQGVLAWLLGTGATAGLQLPTTSTSSAS